jgi:hypothetical protein
METFKRQAAARQPLNLTAGGALRQRVYFGAGERLHAPALSLQHYRGKQRSTEHRYPDTCCNLLPPTAERFKEAARKHTRL